MSLREKFDAIKMILTCPNVNKIYVHFTRLDGKNASRIFWGE